MTPLLCTPCIRGGGLAARVAVNEGTSLSDYHSLDIEQLLADIVGRHVLLGVHGFNVNRADGIASLVSCLR